MATRAPGRLQFVKPLKLTNPAASTVAPENVVTRVRNQTTTGRTVRPFVVGQ